MRTFLEGCRNQFRLLPLFLLSLSLTGHSFQDGIIGNRDDRTEVLFLDTPGSQYVGAIFEDDFLSGTGVLVGPRHVLSAAHVWTKIGKPDPKAMVFKLHYRNGKSTKEVRFVSVDYWAGYQSASGVISRDWVLGVLSEPVGAQFGWVDLASIHPNTDVRIHSYGYGKNFKGDRFIPSVASVHLNCQTFLNVSNEATRDGDVATDCDGPPGASGGPNLWERQRKPGHRKPQYQLLGINTRFDEDYTYYLPATGYYDQWVRSVAWRSEQAFLKEFEKFLTGKKKEFFTDESIEKVLPLIREAKKDVLGLSEAELQLYFQRRLGDQWRTELPNYIRRLNAASELFALPFYAYVLGVTFEDAFAPLVVASVEEGSAAAKSGVQLGDTLVQLSGKLAGRATSTLQHPSLQLLKMWALASKGDFKIAVRRRNGGTENLSFSLGMPTSQAISQSMKESVAKILGLLENYEK